MMMSGKTLPDIQIVAATNPTISAASLRENIRQRFLFKQFEIDAKGTIEYIEKTTGLSIPYEEAKALLEYTSSDYNILTPRSLTKMTKWIAATDSEHISDVIVMITDMWGNRLAKTLTNAWIEKNNATAEIKAKQCLYDLAKEKIVLKELDEYDTVDEIVGMLRKAGYWDEVAEQLKQIKETDNVAKS